MTDNLHRYAHWFDQLWPRLQLVITTALGIFLLTKPSLSATQAAVGSACLGLTLTGIARHIVRNGNSKNGGKQ